MSRETTTRMWPVGFTIAADRLGRCCWMEWGSTYYTPPNQRNSVRQVVLMDYRSAQLGDPTLHRFEKGFVLCVKAATQDAAAGMLSTMHHTDKPITRDQFPELYIRADKNATSGMIRVGIAIEKHRERSTIESSLRLTLAREIWTAPDVCALIGLAAGAPEEPGISSAQWESMLRNGRQQ